MRQLILCSGLQHPMSGDAVYGSAQQALAAPRRPKGSAQQAPAAPRRPLASPALSWLAFLLPV